MAPVYLDVHPPRRDQFYRTRANPIRAQIVLHTAENVPGFKSTDQSAEDVASFIANRSDAGSYHSLVDSDSIVHVGEYGWTMFHVGVAGVNSRTLGLSFACRTSDWVAMEWDRVVRFLKNGAAEARRMSAWLQATYRLEVAPRHLTPVEFNRGESGFIFHAQLDPKRRSDPGREFPMSTFLTYYVGTTDPVQKETPMASDPHQKKAQEYVNAWLTPDLRIKTDGEWGEKSTAALKTVLDGAEATIKAREKELAELRALPSTQKVQGAIRAVRAALNEAEKALG